MQTPFTVYDPSTGMILRNGNNHPQAISEQVMSGEAVTLGSYSSETHFILNGIPHLRPHVPEPQVVNNRLIEFSEPLPDGLEIHISDEPYADSYPVTSSQVALALPLKEGPPVVTLKAPWPYIEKEIWWDGLDGEVPVEAQVIEPDLTTVKTFMSKAVRKRYSQAMLPISSQYSPEEREGWAEQLAEAQKVIDGGQSNLIDALRSATGETATEMAQTILDKRAQYQALYGAATANRRGLDAQITAALTVADLAAIDIEAGWPGV